MSCNTIKGKPYAPETKYIETEVLVLGGGLPGVCAAIQASEMGIKTVLVESRLTLGGNCGPEVGVHPSDAHRFHPYMVSTGTVGKLIEDAAFFNAKTRSEDNHYNISLRWDTIMSKALEHAGVTVLLSHYAHTPYVDNNKITAVLCEDTLTYKRVLISVSGYVIDDTGDGNVSERAGAKYRMGRESRDEFNESLAPEKADKITMGTSLVSILRRTEGESEFYPDKHTPDFYPGYGGDCNIRPKDDSNFKFWFPTETGGDIDTIEDGHDIYKRLRGHLDSAWDKAKNKSNNDSLKNWEMVWVSPKMGKRETRRFEGDHILNQNDIENARLFGDSIAVGGFATDIHYPKKENPEYVSIEYHMIPPVYTVPYRSIYSSNIENLFFASRLMSATHIAHGSVRLQRTLSTIGQAAGMAAALCSKYRITSRQLYTEGHIEELRQELLKNDCTIPNASNNDPNDKAKLAKITASSEIKYGVSGDVTYEKVDKISGVEFWDFTDKIEYIEILMKNTSNEPIEVEFTLKRFVPEHKWQIHGEREYFDYYEHRNEAEWGSEHRLKFFKQISSNTLTVPARFNGYIKVDFNVEIDAKDPMTDDDRLVLEIKTESGALEIGRNSELRSYMRRVTGITEKNDEEKYNVRPESTFAKLYPTPLYGEAIQVINGQNRRFSENPQNMWHPESLPADITLTWDEKITAEQVRITFDTLERTAHEMPFECGKRASDQCVKKFTVKLFNGKDEVLSFTENCNHNRLFVKDFLKYTFDKLILTVEELWDSKRTAGVYEIRIY